MEHFSEFINPRLQVERHLEHCNVFCHVTSQLRLRDDLWQIQVRIPLVRGLLNTTVYFDRPIELDGRRDGFTICIRHADECEFKFDDEDDTKQTAYYFFILDAVIIEAGVQQSFQAAHFGKTFE